METPKNFPQEDPTLVEPAFATKVHSFGPFVLAQTPLTCKSIKLLIRVQRGFVESSSICGT